MLPNLELGKDAFPDLDRESTGMMLFGDSPSHAHRIPHVKETAARINAPTEADPWVRA